MEMTHGTALRIAIEAIKICAEKGILIYIGVQEYNGTNLYEAVKKIEKKIDTLGL